MATLKPSRVLPLTREYQAASKVTADTSPPDEPDPCETCWRTGEDELHEGQGDDFSPTEDTGWGVRLARAIGVAKETEETTDRESNRSGVGGVGAFYYYTLHTTFTTLRLRLKKAQQVSYLKLCE